MVRIAVTGGIACGKSLVGKFLSGQGIPVCEADVLAHEKMSPGTRVFSRVVRVFGNGILGADGAIDRRVLGRRVFSNPQQVAALNAIVHPAVKNAWKEWLAIKQKTARAAAVVVPLLYEVGEGEGWDAVICVTSAPVLQIQRLKGRGLSRPEACRRMQAQMGTAEKAERADFVIVNDGTRTMLEEQSNRVVRHIVEK